MVNLTQELVQTSTGFVTGDGVSSTPMQSLSLFQASAPTRCDANIYRPSFIVTVQGVKNLYLAGEPVPFSPGECLISSIDMPLTSHIVEASPDRPYLSVMFELDMAIIAEFITELQLSHHRPETVSPAISISPVAAPMMDVVRRMIDLLNHPEDIPVLYPMLERELIYRLLKSEQGERLRHLCTFDSSSNKIMRAIHYLQENFQCAVRVESLAGQVNMSVSSLHQHFKAITSLTPLQYQKQLRLYDARRRIMQGMEIASAAYQVGYESPSQFSRDYSRAFGISPSQDRHASV